MDTIYQMFKIIYFFIIIINTFIIYSQLVFLALLELYFVDSNTASVCKSGNYLSGVDYKIKIIFYLFKYFYRELALDVGQML